MSGNGLLLEKGYNIRGIELRVDELVQIHNFYCVASTQEYICENYNVSPEDALKIAHLTREKLDEEDSNETLYIFESAKELGIVLD